MSARSRDHLPTPPSKSPESLEILGALFCAGGFEPHFLLRVDLQSPALLSLLPRFARIVAR